MPNFVYDGTALPDTKTDTYALVGPANQSMQASEFNTVTSASYDLRNGLVSASYFGFVSNSTASVPPAGTARLRFSGSALQVAEGATGVGYRSVPVLDSGSLNIAASLTASASNVGVATIGSLTASNDARVNRNLNVVADLSASGLNLGGVSVTPWTSASLLNNFVNVADRVVDSIVGQPAHASYRTDAFSNLYIRGSVTGSLPGDYVAEGGAARGMFVVPPAFKPQYAQPFVAYFALVGNGSIGAAGVINMVLGTNGTASYAMNQNVLTASLWYNAVLSLL